VKFRIGRDALGEAVAFVSRALPSRPVVPVLSGMLVSVSSDSLTLSCFDYEVSARVRIDAEVAEPGEALVPGRLLAEIVRSLPAGSVEVADEADVVNLRCGRAEFGLVCLPTQDYPRLPASPPAVGVIDGGVLAAAVTQVASSASRDDTLPMLTAMCLDVSGEVATLAATDRYRMAAREVRFTPAEPGLRALALVPARIMVEAARTLSPGVPVAIAFGSRADDQAGSRPGGPGTGPGSAAAIPRPADGLISLESGERRLTARLIAGEFIKYRNRFGEDYACRADLPAGPVIEAVRRAALVAERVGPVRLSFQPDQVVIEAHAEGRARAAETVPAEFTGDQTVISFNPHNLLDGLVAAASAGVSLPGATAAGGGVSQAEAADAPDLGRIRLRFNTPAKPALITWADASGSEVAADGLPAGDAREPRADGDQPGSVQAFRYLLVPLRVTSPL
jgi:DNA polymerase III subunit beta